MPIYTRPKERIHRGYFYLNDEVVINSLSAIEAGKVDEIVSRTNTAREGGFSGGSTLAPAKIEGARKSTSALEEEMVRTRTRFSVFEAWHTALSEKKAIGKFHGWGASALADVSPGDTVEFRATLEPAPLQNLLRLYLWFSEQATSQGNMFSAKGEELRSVKEGTKNVRTILGTNDENDELTLLATPQGEPGPKVILPIAPRWLIGKIGHLGGEFGVVAQVNRVIPEGGEFPVLRLTKDTTPTPLEIATMKAVVEGFVESSAALGVRVSAEDAVVTGPAMILEPIAVYR